MDDTNNAHGSAPDSKPTPWDRLPDEPAQDFATFCAYLRMPAPRSAGGLAVATGLPTRSLDRKRSRYRWAERAAAYDAYRLELAMAAAPREIENPYERMLMQAANRAALLHDAAQKLLMQADRRLAWGERQYQKELAAAKGVDVEPPLPSALLVSCIRAGSDVMDKCAEAQALALGITDVMKMQAQGAGAAA